MPRCFSNLFKVFPLCSDYNPIPLRANQSLHDLTLPASPSSALISLPSAHTASATRAFWLLLAHAMRSPAAEPLYLLFSLLGTLSLPDILVNCSHISPRSLFK